MSVSSRPNRSAILPLSPTFTPFVGEAAPELYFSMSVQAVGLSADSDAGNRLVLARLQQAMPPGTRLISDTVRFSPGAMLVGRRRKLLSFTVTGEGTLLRDVDPEEVRRAVLGCSPEAAAEACSRNVLAGPPRHSSRPDWLPYIVPVKLPILPWRIRVVVDWDAAARLAMK